MLWCSMSLKISSNVYIYIISQNLYFGNILCFLCSMTHYCYGLSYASGADRSISICVFVKKDVGGFTTVAFLGKLAYIYTLFAINKRTIVV